MASNWQKFEMVAAGGYGEVYLAVNESSRKKMAVKSVNVMDDLGYRSLKAEARFLAELKGEPNIVRCFGEDESVESGGRTYSLLLEYAPKGRTLSDLMSENQQMCEPRVACYAKMILRGLSAIHSHGIVHCDLKPNNVLVFGTGGGGYQLKICDFGLAKSDSDEEKAVVLKKRKTHKAYEYQNRGATLYASPESVEKGRHEWWSDVWSLGIMVAEMMTGKQFWDLKKTLYYQILDEPLDLQDRIPKRFSDEGIDFLLKCLDRDPVRRWSAAKLLEHPFIVNGTLSARIPHQIDGENPVDGSSEWLSTKDLFTIKNTGEEEEEENY